MSTPILDPRRDEAGAPGPDVLEHNLRRLFAQSFAPVQPAAEFRARLVTELEQRAGAVHERRGRAAPSRRSPLRLVTARTIAGAAAVLFVALGGWLAYRATVGTSRATLEEILASGRVAVRAGTATEWSALDPRAARRGIEAGDARLDVATPEHIDLRLRFGARENGSTAARVGPGASPDGTVIPRNAVIPENTVMPENAVLPENTGLPENSVLPENAALSEGIAPAMPASDPWLAEQGLRGRVALGVSSRIASDALARTLDVASGTLSVERYDSGAPWILSGAGARIELERGAIDLSIADARPFGGAGPCLVAHLLRGVARAFVGGEPSALAPGTRIVLQGDRALEARFGSASAGAGAMQSPADRGNLRTTVEIDAPAPAAGSPGEEAPPPPAETARLEARIVAPPGVARPRELTVTLLRHERLPAISEPQVYTFDGTERFVVEGLRPGTYDVFVETAAFGVWREVNRVLARGTTHALDVELARGLVLRGRVVDAATGAPIEGAIVISEEDVPAQVIPFEIETPLAWQAGAVTLSDGTFELAHLGPGLLRLRATQRGYGAAWSDPAEPGLDAPSIEIRLARGGAIAGHVTHPDGTPWPDAVVVTSHIGQVPVGASPRLVRMGYGLTQTDALGDYRVDDLPAGAFVVLNVLDAASASSVRQADVRSGATTIVDLPERASGARLSGKLVDADGNSAADLDVTLQPSTAAADSGWSSQRSDAQGRFTFAGLRAGSYHLFVGTGLGRRFLRQATIEVPAAGEIVHDVRLFDGVIRGRAVRAADGEPCGTSFLLVQERTADGFVFAGVDLTSPDGSFTIDRLRPGTWRVLIYPSERLLASLSSCEVAVSAAAPEARCDIAVPLGAALRVVVRGRDGRVLPECAVVFADEHGVAVQLTARDVTGADGVLDVPGVPAGRWSVHARHGGSTSPPVVLDLVPGEERAIELVLGP